GGGAKQVTPDENGRFRTERARLIQRRQGFVVVTIVQVGLGDLRECWSKGRQLRMSSPERAEIFQRAIASTESEIEARQIPLRERAAGLRRISGPTLQFGTRRFSLRTVKLVQLREHARKIDVARPVFDEI